jgi:CPA1 family monovalent cation:H+ antiporter
LEQTPKDALLLQLRRRAIKAERKELIRLWRGNEISDEVMRHQEEILDYQEAQL